MPRVDACYISSLSASRPGRRTTSRPLRGEFRKSNPKQSATAEDVERFYAQGGPTKNLVPLRVIGNDDEPPTAA
jgi:hypothetical protein